MKKALKVSAIFLLGTTVGIFANKLYTKRHTKYAGDIIVDTGHNGDVSIAFNEHWSTLPEGKVIFKVIKKNMTSDGVA